MKPPLTTLIIQRVYQSYIDNIPPLILDVCPVINLDFGEAKKRTASAISSGLAISLSGCISIILPLLRIR